MEFTKDNLLDILAQIGELDEPIPPLPCDLERIKDVASSAVQLQAAEIDRLKAELELRTRLTTAVHALLNKRNNTEWTYEEAYEFTFKGYGRREWNEVIEASGWSPEAHLAGRGE